MFKKFKPHMICLSEKVPENLVDQLNMQKIQDLNEDDEWVIKQEEFALFRFDLIFFVCQTINIDILCIKDMPNQAFLKQLPRPYFTQLYHLKLCDDNITSIEAIAFMNVPQLEQLNIGGNYIRSVRPLVKLFCLNLNQISIDRNILIDPWNSFVDLPRISLGGDKKICEMLKLETKTLQFGWGIPILQFEDLSFIAKLQFRFLVDIKLMHSNRINQQNVRKCRRRKMNTQLSKHIIYHND